MKNNLIISMLFQLHKENMMIMRALVPIKEQHKIDAYEKECEKLWGIKTDEEKR